MSKYPLEIPHPCDICNKSDPDSCCKYAECTRWRRWFKRQWREIQKNYEKAQKRKNTRKGGGKSV